MFISLQDSFEWSFWDFCVFEMKIVQIWIWDHFEISHKYKLLNTLGTICVIFLELFVLKSSYSYQLISTKMRSCLCRDQLVWMMDLNKKFSKKHSSWKWHRWRQMYLNNVYVCDVSKWSHNQIWIILISYPQPSQIDLNWISFKLTKESGQEQTNAESTLRFLKY